MIGNAHIQRYLENPGQSLLLAGPPGVGKGLSARALAKRLLGRENHPDLHIYYPEGKSAMHSIETMRELSSQVYLTPQEGPWKIFIIEYADRMLPTSANALLKTFEEPTPDTLIILITDNREAILPTILSRCRTLLFKPVSEKELQTITPEFAHLARGSVARAKYLAKMGKDPVREVLIHALLGHSYEVQEIADVLENRKKELLAQKREELTPNMELSASFREKLEKQIEGTVALAYAQEVERLFGNILYWYRDLHLLRDTGNPDYLYHRDHVQDLLKRIEKPLPALTKVSDAITKARLATARFTRLSVCLEALFLTFNNV